MASFPQLAEDDLRGFDEALNELLAKTEADTALIVEKAGYLIHQCGKHEKYNTTEVATLVANSFNATQLVARLIHEESFSGMYQQGDKVSMLVLDVDENCLMVIIFQAQHSVGAIKYFAGKTIKQVSAQIEVAQKRTPGIGFDLSDLNPTDASTVFRRKDS